MTGKIKWLAGEIGGILIWGIAAVWLMWFGMSFIMYILVTVRSVLWWFLGW